MQETKTVQNMVSLTAARLKQAAFPAVIYTGGVKAKQA